jgi:sRNA-binding protein
MVDRTVKIEQALAELLTAFPLAFAAEPERIKPLAVGIKQRIFARCALSHRDIGDALQHYAGRVAYLHTIIEGAVRFDLDGAASGTVTAEEATHAAERIEKILANAAGEPKSKIGPNRPAKGNFAKSPAMSGASKPGPRQRILAGLKQAAAVQLATKGASANKTMPQPAAMAGPSNSGPRRLGLADLKQAAAARRTTKGARASQI